MQKDLMKVCCQQMVFLDLTKVISHLAISKIALGSKVINGLLVGKLL